jgi:hypothetical protein
MPTERNRQKLPFASMWAFLQWTWVASFPPNARFLLSYPENPKIADSLAEREEFESSVPASVMSFQERVISAR